MKPALRLEMQGSTLNPDTTLDVAACYINKINAKLAKSGYGQNCVRYKSHHQSGNNCFVLCATAPMELHEWIDKLPHCNALVFQGDEVEFRLNIPIKQETREVSSATHQAVKGVIES